MKTKRLFGMTILGMVCLANLYAQEGIAPRRLLTYSFWKCEPKRKLQAKCSYQYDGDGLRSKDF